MRMDYEPAARPERDGDRRERVGPEVLRQVEWPSWQTVRIFHEKEGTPKSGQGRYLRVGMEICDGPCEGYTIWQYFNVHSANKEAQRIGREQLAELMLATGLPRGADSKQLKGHTVRMRCELEDSPQHGKSLKGTNWRPVSGNGVDPIQGKQQDGAPPAPSDWNDPTIEGKDTGSRYYHEREPVSESEMDDDVPF